MTSNKTAKDRANSQEESADGTQPRKDQHQFDCRTDIGLNLAGGAQKLPGPHRTTRKGTSKGTSKVTSKGTIQEQRNILFIENILHLKQ